MTPSATNPTLSQNGWKTFFRGLGNDNTQGPAAAKFITGELKANKVCVIKDDSDYGTGLAASTIQALGDKGTCQDSVKTKQTDFSAVVNKIKSENRTRCSTPGTTRKPRRFAQQLNDAGVEAKFIGPDGVKDDEFVKGAGEAAAKALLHLPVRPGGPVHGVHRRLQGRGRQGPGHLLARGLRPGDDPAQGHRHGQDRTAPALLDFVKSYDGQGITKHFKWDDKGELSSTTVWTYKVEGGKIVRNDRDQVAQRFRSRLPGCTSGGSIPPGLHPGPTWRTSVSLTHHLGSLVLAQSDSWIKFDGAHSGPVLEQHVRRADLRQHLRAGGDGLHPRLRRAEAHQLRPLRGVHLRGLRDLVHLLRPRVPARQHRPRCRWWS